MLQQINKENFQQMLGQFSTGELEGMVEKFPYFEQAHLLLAKKYQQENSPKFDQQLQLAALYVQDRELLYTLFNEKSAVSIPVADTVVSTKPEPVEEIHAPVEEVTPPIAEIKSIAVAEIHDHVEQIEAPREEQKPAEDADLKAILEELERSARQLSAFAEQPVEEKEKEAIEATQPEIKELENESVVQPVTEEIAEPIEESLELHTVHIEEIAAEVSLPLEQTVEERQVDTVELTQPEIKEEENQSVDETVAEEIAEPIEDKKELQSPAEQIEEIVAEERLHVEQPVEEKQEEPVELAPAETEEIAIQPVVTEEQEEPALEETSLIEDKPVEVFSRIEPHTFDEWLKAFNNKSVAGVKEETPAVKEEPVTEKDELAELLAVNISVDYLHELVKEETTYAKGLERFIEEQIQKHKQPEVKKQAIENDLNTEPATETMAKVYEMQKKYTKAIKTYEALTLKFPEKSSLFAARINYLKNIL